MSDEHAPDASGQPDEASGPPTPVGEGALPEKEPLVRTARKDGRHVVTLRTVDRGVDSVVECAVYPVNSLRVEPLRPGPHSFSSRDEANAFIEEALRALRYLGCDVS